MSHTVEIAPTEEALTFARTGSDADRRMIAVTSYTEGRIRGVDLSRLAAETGDDPIRLINREGYDRLKDLIDAAADFVEVPAATLSIPVDLTAAHIAAGTNYTEHAEEATVEGGPFLFPKLVQPTGPTAPISVGEALLDYEVELCLVALETIDPEAGAVSGGLILCNDVTDRAALLRHVDPWNPESGKGFTTGKSAPGYLPVGNLFVVPRDLEAFVAGLELTLSVNGEHRQSAPVTQWIWDFDEIVRQAAARRDTEWAYRGGMARLPFEGRVIPARTLILAGTPAGTVFAGLPWTDRLRGVLDWLFGGWGKSIPAHVVERYIARARAQGVYLQSGDVVVIRVDRMGVLANSIVP